MNKKHLWGMAQIGLLVMATTIGARTQAPPCQSFSGVLNGYSPQTTATGPYEVRGPWSLTIDGETGKATFSAAVNMELSDGWVITRNGSDFDPAARGAHTHHIRMVADVTETSEGIQVKGTATVTLNGSPAPVSPTPLEIDITGGTKVKYSNINLTFGAPGSMHFGTTPLPGVVQSYKK